VREVGDTVGECAHRRKTERQAQVERVVAPPRAGVPRPNSPTASWDSRV
jgi:hypothetical protein